MENRIIEQFKGFLNTYPLWEGSGPFQIEQFLLPSFDGTMPAENEFLAEIPSLSRNFVMGKRMESYFSFLIRNSSQFDLLAENLQISRNKITIGEIDFIVKDKGAEDIMHIELVYKFYVYDPSFENEEERWIGPNRRDSLLQKITKLKEHQVPLIHKKETRDALVSLKIDSKTLKQKVCFKASLFVPREMQDKPFPIINNSCICGYWIHLDDFRSKEFRGNMYFMPKKPDWAVDPKVNAEWFPYPEIYIKVKELQNMKISPLLWMKIPGGEVERFFIVWW